MPGETGKARRGFVLSSLLITPAVGGSNPSPLPGETARERILFGAVFRCIRSPGVYLRSPAPGRDHSHAAAAEVILIAPHSALRNRT